MATCKICGTNLEENQSICPFCGANQEQQTGNAQGQYQNTNQYAGQGQDQNNNQYGQQGQNQNNNQYGQQGQYQNNNQYSQQGQYQNNNQYNQQGQNQNNQNKGNSFEDVFNTTDYTTTMDPTDIRDNKGVSVVGYFGILFLIPIFCAPNSRFARFHANQSLLLFLARIAWGIISIIVTTILASIHLGILSTLICYFGRIALLAFWILGIVNAAQGKAKELPFIGKFRLIK